MYWLNVSDLVVTDVNPLVFLLQMNDPIVQSKALYELLPLYDEAGSLSDRKRRRRQAKSKNRPRL